MKNLNKLKLEDKKYIIFDMDGTLIDSIGVWNETDYYLIKKYAGISLDLNYIQQDRDNFLNSHCEGDSYIKYSEYLIHKYNFSINDVEFLVRDRWNMLNNILTNDVCFKPNVSKLIYKLKELEYKIILATMTTIRQLDIYTKENKNMLAEMDILKTFDYIVKIDDVEKKKPDPEIFNKIVDYYHALKKEFLIFEDSYTGILAAHNAGIEVVCVYDKYADLDRDKINKLTDYNIKDYQEIIDIINHKNNKQLIHKM